MLEGGWGRWASEGTAKRRFCEYYVRRRVGRDGGGSLPQAWHQSFYLWKKKYAGPGLSEFCELRQLREDNSKLKRSVEDLRVNRHILQDRRQKAVPDFDACRRR
jgi:hypothetical protein